MNKDWISSARTLSEALPYLQRYDKAIVVIKIGGNAMINGKILKGFARDIVLLRQVGVNTVVIHGGGPKITSTLKRLGIESNFVRGKRVSCPETVEVVEMVLSGNINKDIVQAINSQGGQAIGISGKDANLMICDIIDPELGMVGQPKKVNSEVLLDLLKNGFIPVIAPIGISEQGQTLNVNGDTAAGSIASALKADRLLLLTDVDGVLDQKGDLISRLSPSEAHSKISDGIIHGGMIPKTETSIKAIEKGVRAVAILNGTTPNAILLELFTNRGVGTLITPR